MNQSKLTAQWWQYFLNDMQPPDGVHFISSTMIAANDKEKKRTLDSVPSNRMIVMPVNNWISLAKEHATIGVKADMIKTAKTRMDSVTYNTKLNDQNIKPSRVMSPFFQIELIDLNMKQLQNLQVGQLQGPGKYIGLSDGYWLFLNLQEGEKYTVKNVSSCATGVYTLNMDHELLVS